MDVGVTPDCLNKYDLGKTVYDCRRAPAWSAQASYAMNFIASLSPTIVQGFGMWNVDKGGATSIEENLARHPRSRFCPIRIACSRASVWRVVSSTPRDQPRRRVCCLLRSVSGSGQLIEIASRAVQPLLDGSRCRFFCCLTSLGSFLAIIPRRQCWRVLGLVHEPQHSTATVEERASRRFRPAL